ncbi:MAG: bifunctional precorrin-2 dehydrogenase/sirohydrochlorin ferrochelatase [bacterium]|nr:bifunctional precorrin-2 dehydrogenase/sirohydrochlorin ferrochelatase [bacterium]
MAYFPLFIELDQKDCLIIGGGPVAARKAKVLASLGAKVEIISDTFCEELTGKEFRNSTLCKLSTQEVSIGFLEEKKYTSLCIIVAATSNHELNHEIGLWCRAQGIHFNSATSKQDSTFIFPSVINKEGITVGITSGGKSPAVTRMIRSKVEQCIPNQLEVQLQELEQARELVKQKVKEQRLRKIIFYELIQIGIEQQQKITNVVINQVIDKVIREDEDNNQDWN